ncbi:MAG TPA: Glu/Leu/Phe/Val dehydrogenase, partial [Ignavibacteria bacterium]|nr:Glu/Leu/Phe/Val dehydrogenase [Ignavibacteria bacterium]
MSSIYKEPAPYRRDQPNPFDSMLVRFDKAAEMCKLDEGLYNYLKHPVKQVIVSIPITMDNGKLEVFEGY